MAKIHCDLTFENEKVTYAKIIENQTKELVKSLLIIRNIMGFYLKLVNNFRKTYLFS